MFARIPATKVGSYPLSNNSFPITMNVFFFSPFILELLFMFSIISDLLGSVKVTFINSTNKIISYILIILSLFFFINYIY